MYQAGRARRRSLAAGMTLALACRGAALVTNSASALVKARLANVATPAVRALPRRTAWGVARRVGGPSLVQCANGSPHTIRRGGGGSVTMCSGAAAGLAGADVEVSAEGLALEASIKTKGDTIRELKAGGASKDDLKQHIEVRECASSELPADVEVLRGAPLAHCKNNQRSSSCHTCASAVVGGSTCTHMRAASELLALGGSQCVA